MARAAGREIPENVAVDRIEQLPSLLGTAAKPARTAVILQGISGAVALRDGHWKFIQSNADKTVNEMGSGAKPCSQSISIPLAGVGIPGSWIGWLEACEVGLPRVDC